MNYKGKEIGYKRTVGAVAELSKLAPGGKIERMGELFAGELGATMESGSRFLHILNKWYEKSQEFEQENYVATPVPAEFYLTLDMEDYTAELNKAMKQFGDDDLTTIEGVEDPDIKKNIEEIASSLTLPGISSTGDSSE